MDDKTEKEVQITIPPKKNIAKGNGLKEQCTVIKDDILTANILYDTNQVIVTVVASPYINRLKVDSSEYKIINGKNWIKISGELINKTITLKYSYKKLTPIFPKVSSYKVIHSALNKIYSDNFNNEEYSIMKYDLGNGITKYPLHLSKNEDLQYKLTSLQSKDKIFYLVKLSINKRLIDSVILDNISNSMISEEYAFMETNKKETNSITVYGQYSYSAKSNPFLYFLDPNQTVNDFITDLIKLIANIDSNRDVEVEISDKDCKVNYVLYPYDNKTLMKEYVNVVYDPCRVTIVRR